MNYKARAAANVCNSAHNLFRLAECFKYSCAYFLPWVSFFKKKKMFEMFFPLLSWHLPGYAWIVDPVPQQGDYRGLAFNSHVTDKENIWTISFLSFANNPRLWRHAAEASYFMVGWQVCVLTTGSAVSNQTVFSKAPLHSVERESRDLIK